MKPIFQTYRPDGFHTMNGYLFVSNPDELIHFLKEAFHAEEINRTVRPDNGGIGNCILKIGDSCFMVSQANGPFMDMRTAFYLYVVDVDQVFKRALELGGKAIFDPENMDYGDRQGGIEDVSGNYWWISKRLKEKGYHE